MKWLTLYEHLLFQKSCTRGREKAVDLLEAAANNSFSHQYKYNRVQIAFLVKSIIDHEEILKHYDREMEQECSKIGYTNYSHLT